MAFTFVIYSYHILFGYHRVFDLAIPIAQQLAAFAAMSIVPGIDAAVVDRAGADADQLGPERFSFNIVTALTAVA